MIIKYSFAWVGMLILAIINATIRETVYSDFTTELTAHQISSITAIGLFFLYTLVLSTWWRIESPRDAFTIGFIWLSLTIIFEFLFGHFVMNNSWHKLLYDYNIFAGRIWSLVLVAVFLIPYIVFKIRQK